MKKKILIILSIFLLLVLTACGTPDQVTLEDEGSLDADFCKTNKLEDKVIVFESRYCHNCEEAKPHIQAVADKLNKEFLFLDLAGAEEYKQMEEMNLMVKLTPTILANCNVIIGAKSEQQYDYEITKALGL